jgi:hypothetical protein
VLVSNKKDFQVIKDQKGIRRKIEYRDQDDSLQYSKSVFKKPEEELKLS